jgi:ABC-type dipeptide/oligopeptide/nickel transport system permease component
MFVSPGNTGLETFYFDNTNDSEGTIEQIKSEITHIKPDPRSASGQALETDINNESTDKPAKSISSGLRLGQLIRILFIGILFGFILLIALKHPYIGRRLVLMIPMLAIISVAVFAIIQLPPGNYINTYIMRLKEQFFLDDPVPMQYSRWMGFNWFVTFDAKDTGLLQGNMGRSMETRQSVNDLVGDRLLLTFLISLGTILFTWALAIPIGIYSAVRQYTVGDYILTFVGFIGMCVPSFLLALILIYLSNELLGIRISGLFSSEFSTQAEWNGPKIADLLQHIWVPVLVLGIGGTAGMIRVMRANLLDELKKPYVITAMAKGVRPTKLLMKYPVRLALNPFVSGIGGLFPALISGGAIVAIVLNLPTVGPLMLTALMSEDMYLAGSMLMVLSLLSIFGTLVSDLLLLWLDPRIRYEGGKR